MAGQRTFFSKRLVSPGTEISFDSPTPSKWTIVKKLSEAYHQLTERDVKNGQGPSYSQAKLLCRNIADPAEQAFMRIYMQIPYQGTEAEPPEDRAQQASSRTHEELTALKTFTDKNSKITPTLLAYKEDKQDDRGIVPGGYITYLVWNILPGLRLGDNLGAAAFWHLPPTERDDIRAFFEKEYKQLGLLGFYPEFPGAKNLLWNSSAQMIYFIGFRDCFQADKSDAWNDAVLARWGLAIPPKSCRWWRSGWDGNTDNWQF